MKKKFEGSISFFIDANEKEIKNKTLDILNAIPKVDVIDVYNDGEDWCIDCIVTVLGDSIKSADSTIKKIADKANVTWDYHYIKGIGNNEYWQP